MLSSFDSVVLSLVMLSFCGLVVLSFCRLAALLFCHNMVEDTGIEKIGQTVTTNCHYYRVATIVTYRPFRCVTNDPLDVRQFRCETAHNHDPVDR